MFDQQLPKDDYAIQEIKNVALDMSGWLKFIGIAAIVYGGLIALTIIGIIIAWLPIWIGILLLSAGNKAKDAHYTGNTMHLIEMMRKLKTFFMLQGILLIIGLVGLILMLATVGLAFFTTFRSLNSY